MILSWWDAASKRWEYAWTANELEPAHEPRLVVAQPSSHPRSPAWEFLNGTDADINERGDFGGGGDLGHFCIFLDAHTCYEIVGLMLIKWKLEFAFVCIWQFLCMWCERGPEKETDLVRLGWQVSRRLLQAAMLPFDTTGFVEQTWFSSFFFFPLSIAFHLSLKLSLSACNVFRAFIISLPQILPFLWLCFSE